MNNPKTPLDHLHDLTEQLKNVTHIDVDTLDPVTRALLDKAVAAQQAEALRVAQLTPEEREHDIEEWTQRLVRSMRQ